MDEKKQSIWLSTTKQLFFFLSIHYVRKSTISLCSKLFLIGSQEIYLKWNIQHNQLTDARVTD